MGLRLGMEVRLGADATKLIKKFKVIIDEIFVYIYVLRLYETEYTRKL